MKQKVQIINDSVFEENFSRAYPFINKHVLENGEIETSRNGSTKEILDFKTTITNPYKRCVGNNERNINIFFLLAEAIWIWLGKKDVETLALFNEQMREYTDDGKFFHAPYGFRLRRWGLSSFDELKPISENQNHSADFSNSSIDQIYESLVQLSEDPQSRRVVMSIWNPDLDCNKKSKDLPCNDLVMLKIRNNKLITTIANRSNDLHWGLPTNIFQFSFITELMSLILNVELGTQTHNSQSLHVYTDNPIGMKMYENLQFSNSDFFDLYDIAFCRKIDFNFNSKSVAGRLLEIDSVLELILESFIKTEGFKDDVFMQIKNKSEYFSNIYSICHVYLSYKKSPITDKSRMLAVEKLFISSLQTDSTELDIFILAQNFFLHRIKDSSLIAQNSKLFTTKELL